MNPGSDVDNDTLPPLHFSFRWINIVRYILFLLILNIAVPCILFYVLRTQNGITDDDLLGSAAASFGVSSFFDSSVRLYRLLLRRQIYGPIGSDNWRYLDFVMWTYGSALFVFIVPLVAAPTLGNYHFFTMGTVMLVGPVGVIAFVSLFAPILPIRCSSDAKGTPMKPAAFYVVEDIAAVDFLEGRAYRYAINARWNASPPFRHMIKMHTMFFTFAVAVYAGITAAVTFSTPVSFAFGWVLAQLFLWAACVALVSWFITRIGLRREKVWWDARSGAGESNELGDRKTILGQMKGEIEKKELREQNDSRASESTVEPDINDWIGTVEDKKRSLG